MNAKPIVVLGMFDTSRPDRARSVRIRNMVEALSAETPTMLLSGNRPHRRMQVLRFLLGGGLRRTRALYVEASTSTATESDLLLLTLAQRRGIPVIVYIPDAYQYFPALYPRRGVKVALLDWGWRRSIAAYLRVADVLVFPSPGLASYFPARQKSIILPPGGVPGLEPARPADGAPKVFYVGGATSRYGSDLLLDAMGRVVVQMPDACCHFVTGETAQLDNHPLRNAPWLTAEHRSFDELPAIMRTATIAVSPLRRTVYNDLAVPVKLFDFMSFGLPVVVTACTEMAKLVNSLQAGIVVDDTADALAAGILQLLADRSLAQQMGRNGYQAIQTAHSWSQRARQVLAEVEALEG